MTVVPLLDREREVAIAKRIEAGKRRILAAIVGAPLGMAMILELPARLKRGELGVDEMLRHTDVERGSTEEQLQLQRSCRLIEQLCRLDRGLQAATKLPRTGMAARARRLARIAKLQARAVDLACELRLSDKLVEPVGRRLQELAGLLERGERSTAAL